MADTLGTNLPNVVKYVEENGNCRVSTTHMGRTLAEKFVCLAGYTPEDGCMYQVASHLIILEAGNIAIKISAKR